MIALTKQEKKAIHLFNQYLSEDTHKNELILKDLIYYFILTCENIEEFFINNSCEFIPYYKKLKRKNLNNLIEEYKKL